MKKLFCIILFINSSLSYGLTVEQWWDMCGKSSENEATCLLMVTSLESGIKAQATYAAIEQGYSKLPKLEAAKINGFCWDASNNEKWGVKYQYFKAHITELYYSNKSHEEDLGLMYRLWFSKRYSISQCVKT